MPLIEFLKRLFTLKAANKLRLAEIARENTGKINQNRIVVETVRPFKKMEFDW